MKTLSTEITIEVAGKSRHLLMEIRSSNGKDLSARVSWVDDPYKYKPSPHGTHTPWIDADDWFWDLISHQQYRRLMERFEAEAEEEA